MLLALSAPSPEKWQKYERRSMAKQQEFIERYRDDFDKVPITNPDSIKAGDHLVFERNYYLLHYDHHMLCTFSGDNHVLVIHYTAPASGASRALRSFSFKDFGIKAEVKETMFSFEELLEQQVCIKETTINLDAKISTSHDVTSEVKDRFVVFAVFKESDQSPAPSEERNENKSVSLEFLSRKSLTLWCFDLIKVFIR